MSNFPHDYSSFGATSDKLSHGPVSLAPEKGRTLEKRLDIHYDIVDLGCDRVKDKSKPSSNPLDGMKRLEEQMASYMERLMQELMSMLQWLMRLVNFSGKESDDDSAIPSSGQGGGASQGAPCAQPGSPASAPSATHPETAHKPGGHGQNPDATSAAPNSPSAPAAPASGMQPSAAPARPAAGAAVDRGNATPPPNAINVKDFGVVGDGKTDDQAAIQQAFDAAKTQGKPVWFPPGEYRHSDVLTADGIKVSGAGDSTVLRADNPDKAALKLTGDGGEISNLKTEVAAGNRSSQPDAAAILVQNATNATVTGVTTQGAASNGIRLDNAQNSIITGNLVQGSNADGIALMNGSSNNTVSKNVVHQAGDDAFSDNSYLGDAKQDVNNRFDGNMALDNKYGRGFALMGSSGGIVTNNIINGTPGASIMAGTDGNSATMAGSGARIQGNTVMNEYNETDRGRHSTPVTPQAVKDAMGSLPSVADILGWEPALVDKSEYNTGYEAGTGHGANNSGGQRS